MTVKYPKDMLNDISDMMRDLEDAINTLESDSVGGQIDEGSLKNISAAKGLSSRISGLFDSMSKYIKQKVKEKDSSMDRESRREYGGDYD